MSIFGHHDDAPATPSPEAPAELEPAPAPSALKTVEQWAAQKKTPDWAFGAAKAGNAWGQGRELSEADYDAALERATGMLMTAGNPF